MLERLEHWARTAPDRTYLTQPLPNGSVVEYSWARVRDESRRMAAYLQSLELPAGSSIAIYGKNCAHWIMADFAIWLAGHVSVPLYPSASSLTADYVLRHCDARLIFIGRVDGVTDSWNDVQRVLPAWLPQIGLPMSPASVSVRWDDLVAAREPLSKAVERDENALATIIYTSGTTGQPKGVMHSFHSLTAPCLTTASLWGTSPDDRMLSYLPLAHIAERVALEVPSLTFGFQVFFNLNLETFAQDLKRARPTRFFSVPRLWTKFYQAVNQQLPPEKQKVLFADPVQGPIAKKNILAGLGLDAANLGFTGAAPLPAQILSWYRELGLDLIEVYGMTENAATSHASPRDDVRPGYVGVPLPGVECRLGEDGEVLVKSPGQMLGYYRAAEDSQQCFTPDGFFHTGDRGELDQAGRLRITGRVKELFKTSKGKYVAPVPIENRLGAHPFVEAICVTGHGEPQPFALLMLAADKYRQAQADAAVHAQLDRELSGLLEQVNASLEAHEQVDYLVVAKEPWTIESGLLTPTMKIRRSQIEGRYLARAAQWRELAQPVIWES
ncbi:AMP-binding protein [Steroidobacter flavus]|uniref:AMP-binding protein n=1 Tax=Steroidobacter flavus TaxID=1842136 RepID=A0ABV8T5N1_9GAMM